VRTVLAAALVGAVLGCSDAASPATVAGQTAPTSADWLRAPPRRVVHDHCSAGAPFRTCSDTTREQCDSAIRAALRPCTQTMRERLPDRVDARDDEQLRLELTGCVWHHAAFVLGPSRIHLRCLLTPR
jgi:hypothetical protein